MLQFHLQRNPNQGLPYTFYDICGTFLMLFQLIGVLICLLLCCLPPILLACRDLLNQTYKEGRILLTRDVKLLKYQYLAGNQVYRMKSLLKHDQLAEVCAYFDLFHLKYDLSTNPSQVNAKCPMAQGHVGYIVKTVDLFTKM